LEGSVEFSHLDDGGNARMVDVSSKAIVRRTAIARGMIQLSDNTLDAIRDDTVPKGDVLTVANIAGIQAAKRASDIIPLCHPLILDKIGVEFKFVTGGIHITSTVVCIGRTGVEMEALTAVSAAALAIYDMCKAVDTKMVISDIRLIEKTKEPMA
jgi:cyclic pyranopterin monophosphate synthase